MTNSWKPQELFISYHQFTIFQKNSKPPIIDWTDEAIEKGYAEADGAVSFEAQRNSKVFIILRLNSSDIVESYEKKATVPFHVSGDGINIESVMSKRLSFDLPKGQYVFTCYTVPAEASDLHADTYIIDAAAQ
ncbi:competence protein ComJ [Bacillus atrophaeus]|uniref:Inhibitor of the DNA degrading activity of NucA (Competence) n=1 Tax=Bacillus atrophaeus (strain 1942) TaxID=720555 RepID=A0ABM5M4P9_BACA1|nr:competence protein ComJ [Bacillus atrophaeus]AMR64160.1 peptidase S24 [Bacillus subtilis subsp. globigii]ADP34993.1 inhibitor of the DNA degrading activity of NucA (competence) [Bacillus atrophaeus 1942]AIK49146.1 competence J family protein [Bacillus atrophaeus subsp. globigii]EIM09782.1 inhibitor of the DNA degrading activity of NucA [Bacillus atrophaeus C89]KFK81087.1 competence J family protein [Bacillus atrophaeus]